MSDEKTTADRTQPPIQRLLESLQSCADLTEYLYNERTMRGAHDDPALRFLRDIASNARCLAVCVKDLSERVEELEGARPTGGPK